MRLHFIACGGAIMHNLAIAMKNKGHFVTGSDDKLYDPAKSRLQQNGLLPPIEGFFAEKIDGSIDAVILGMHAHGDNPELKRAVELGIPVRSFPEFIYEHAIEKTRIVVAGSHGKTTITSMVMHCLKSAGLQFDYLVGAAVKGFGTGVHLTEDAGTMIIEGDEYLASTLNPVPKFLYYKPHFAVISGVAWDHINVFPTFENYLQQFELFVNTIQPNGKIFFDNSDAHYQYFKQKYPDVIVPYALPGYSVSEGKTTVHTSSGDFELKVFGEHNLKNVEAAHCLCNALKMSDKDFYNAIATFEGAARRLEKIAESTGCVIYKDFAHSPSKLKATVQAVKRQFADRKLIACMELHTYSSLNRNFLSEYKASMADADEAVVFYNPEAARLKRQEIITAADIKTGFARDSLLIFSDSAALREYLMQKNWSGTNLLLMTSGDFGGINLDSFALEIVKS